MKEVEGMNNLPRVSIIIPTRDRPKDLADLLSTILNQSYPSLEVIVVDDSDVCSAKPVAEISISKLKSMGSKLKYLKASGDGLPAARNLAVKISEGDLVLFLDDDTLLDHNAVKALATFFVENPEVMGVQPTIMPPTMNMRKNRFPTGFGIALFKVLMLGYSMENKLVVRRSGMSISPSNLTKTVSTQRLSGCCCYRSEVFRKLNFDTNLKRVGSMEDLDFSFRLYKMYPQSLYAIPCAKITHKGSPDARLPTKLSIYMSTVYWCYVFFKDIYEGSTWNLIAFLWALSGNLMITAGGLIVKRKSKREWRTLIYMLGSYATALRNLKNIRMARLDFFNKNL